MGVEHMANARFKPGQSGNPAGRKKGQSTLKAILRRMVYTKVDAYDFLQKRPRWMSVQEAMVLALIRKALHGDVRAFKEIIDRLEGPVRPYSDPEQDQIIMSPKVVYLGIREMGSNDADSSNS